MLLQGQFINQNHKHKKSIYQHLLNLSAASIEIPKSGIIIFPYHKLFNSEIGFMFHTQTSLGVERVI